MKRAGYGSESEVDEEAATVSLASDVGRVNKASTKSAVKLQEIGPRMTLELIKIEDGLCSGTVIYGNIISFASKYLKFNNFNYGFPFFAGGSGEKKEQENEDDTEDVVMDD